MSRLFFIAVLLVVVAGCNNERFVRKRISNITPIANSESFYAFDSKDTIINGKYTELHSFVHIDPGGIIRKLKDLDTSFTTYRTILLDDSTILYDNFRDTTIRLYHIYSGKQEVLLRGYGLDIASKNKKFILVHHNSDRFAYTSYELRGAEVREVGKMRTSGGQNNSYGDSGFCYVLEDWNERPVKRSVVYSGADLKPLRIVSADSVERSEYNSHPDLSELSAHALQDDFKGHYFSAAYSLPDTNYLLIRGKTDAEYQKEEDRRLERWKEERKKGNYIDYRAQEGYWLVADLRTKTLKKIGDEYWRPYFSSTRKTILFVYRDNDIYSLKAMSLADMLK